MPAIYAIYSQTSFITNLIEVVLRAMLSFKGFSVIALQVSSCLQDSTSSNQKTGLTDQRGPTLISAALCLGSNNLSASTWFWCYLWLSVGGAKKGEAALELKEEEEEETYRREAGRRM